MKLVNFIYIGILLIACEPDQKRSDAYGNFEATTVTVSTETPGKLLKLSVDEGDEIKQGAVIAVVDTTSLHLQKLQILARMRSLASKTLKIEPEIRVLLDQKENLLREKKRVEELLKNKAATPKQLDDLSGELKVLEQRISANRQKARNTNSGILAERDPLRAQIALIDDQIQKSIIKNPIDGRVLHKLAEASEVLRMGAPLYRIAKLNPLELRAYAGSAQLQSVSLGDEVEVLIDEGTDGYQRLKGTLSWISSEAEFTPKTIQTKEERVSLVYAIKVRVDNPQGKLKIGMPAEVNFANVSLAKSSE